MAIPDRSPNSINNPDDFANFYDQNHSKIYDQLLYRTGDVQLAEDLASQTFLNAWIDSRDPDRGPRYPKAWLDQIARNLTTDHFRREARRPTVTLTDGIAQEPSPQMEAVRIDFLDKIGAEVPRLPKRQREIIELRFFGEQTSASIAEELGIKEGTVKSTQSMAVELLRKRMGI